MTVADGYKVGYSPVMDQPLYTPMWLPSELLMRLKGLEHNWVGFRGGDLPFPVAMSLGRSPDGRLICTALYIGDLDVGADYDPPADAPEWYGSEPIEVTARSLRELPLAALLGSIEALRDDPKGRAFFREVFRLADDLPALPRRRPGPEGYDRAKFEEVAEAYRACLALAPRAPVKVLAKRLQVSEATARRWVRRARDMGLLGASTPGRAGEGPVGAEVDRARAEEQSPLSTAEPKEGQ
jgi:transposase-like protein